MLSPSPTCPIPHLLYSYFMPFMPFLPLLSCFFFFSFSLSPPPFPFPPRTCWLISLLYSPTIARGSAPQLHTISLSLLFHSQTVSPNLSYQLIQSYFSIPSFTSFTPRYNPFSFIYIHIILPLEPCPSRDSLSLLSRCQCFIK